MDGQDMLYIWLLVAPFCTLYGQWVVEVGMISIFVARSHNLSGFGSEDLPIKHWNQDDDYILPKLCPTFFEGKALVLKPADT